MRKLCVLLALTAASVIAGCAGPKADVRGEGPDATPTTRTAHHATQWQQYLRVMSERERIEFLNILGDADRRQWVRTNGIDVRAELANKLARGITMETAKRRLNDPVESQETRGDATMLYYSRFNGDTRTNYYLKFESNQLVNWNTYTIAQQDRTLDLVTFEAEISRRLDIALRPGMGAHQITQLANLARKRLDDVMQGPYRERITNTDADGHNDYKRRVKIEIDEKTGKYVAKTADGGSEVIVHRPGADNYLVEEQVLLTTAQADFLGWFALEPSRKIIHRPFETHLFYIPYKNKRGKAETVIVEFSYKDGLLEQWFVYHDE
ncbi:MAG: hypothetical protein IT462_16465 [Planctomycetes bacterium]|nr:hypothetical protein [Planctomycetota bacterium]